VIQGAKDSLDTVVKSTTTFGATNTFVDYQKTVNTYPHCFIKLKNDSIDDVGPAETQHILTFRLIVVMQGTGVEANLNSIIGYVGEIVDAIEADRDLSNARVLRTEVRNVSYTDRELQSFVQYYAHLDVEVELLRNV